MPNESVDFLDGVLDLVVSVCGFDPQLKNQPVKLVYNKGDLDALLESMSDDLFCVHHDLGKRRNPIMSTQRRGE